MSAPAGAAGKRGGRVRNHEVAATVIAAVRSARDDIAAQDRAVLEMVRNLRSEVRGLTAAVESLADATRALLSARPAASGPAPAVKPRAARTGKDA